jgi:hypothetical protein
MRHGLQIHAAHSRDSLRPLIDQSFRTLAVLMLVILVIGIGVAALHLLTG